MIYIVFVFISCETINNYIHMRFIYEKFINDFFSLSEKINLFYS